MEKHTLIGKYFIALLLVVGISTTTYGQRSLYKDNKAVQVGDVLTVILQENISGSTSADAQNEQNAGAGAGGSVGGNFMPFQPTFGADAEVNYESGEQVSSNQGQLLEGYMSVEVTDTTPAGNLFVEGTRSTEINGEKHEIDISGTVRPRDINGRNEVLSYRLANAQINYEKEDGVNRLTKKEGFFKRAALTVAGIGLSVVAVFKAIN